MPSEPLSGAVRGAQRALAQVRAGGAGRLLLRAAGRAGHRIVSDAAPLLLRAHGPTLDPAQPPGKAPPAGLPRGRSDARWRLRYDRAGRCAGVPSTPPITLFRAACCLHGLERLPLSARSLAARPDGGSRRADRARRHAGAAATQDTGDWGPGCQLTGRRRRRSRRRRPGWSSTLSPRQKPDCDWRSRPAREQILTASPRTPAGRWPACGETAVAAEPAVAEALAAATSSARTSRSTTTTSRAFAAEWPRGALSVVVGMRHGRKSSAARLTATDPRAGSDGRSAETPWATGADTPSGWCMRAPSLAGHRRARSGVTGSAASTRSRSISAGGGCDPASARPEERRGAATR